MSSERRPHSHSHMRALRARANLHAKPREARIEARTMVGTRDVRSAYVVGVVGD